MDKEVRNRVAMVEMLAHNDQIYMQLLEECITREEAYCEILEAISPEQTGELYAFICACIELHRRKLELACTYLRFPEEQLQAFSYCK